MYVYLVVGIWWFGFCPNREKHKDGNKNGIKCRRLILSCKSHFNYTLHHTIWRSFGLWLTPTEPTTLCQQPFTQPPLEWIPSWIGWVHHHHPHYGFSSIFLLSLPFLPHLGSINGKFVRLFIPFPILLLPPKSQLTYSKIYRFHFTVDKSTRKAWAYWFYSVSEDVVVAEQKQTLYTIRGGRYH